MTSFVIPLYDERESLRQLYSELTECASAAGLDPCEFVFVDDGSRDGSWDVIRALASEDSRVSAIRFRRNFGKAAALAAGFRAARGELVFTLDADLQDNPSELGRFLSRLNEGFDVVSGWKRRRHDPWHKVWPSRVFNAMVSRLTGLRLHDHNCGYKLYRAEAIREVEPYGELHRFLPVLAHARGFRVGEVEVAHRARRHGTSKYGVARFVKGFLDLLTVRFLTTYGQRPLHVFGTVGLSLLGIGLLGLLYLAALWLMGERPIGVRPLLAYSVAALVVGTQLFSLGVLGEMITAYGIRGRQVYSVAERLGAEIESPEPSNGGRGAAS